MVQLRFVNDGNTPRSTQVIDPVTEKPVYNVTSFMIEGNGSDPYPRAFLTVYRTAFDVVAETTIYERCAYCGHTEVLKEED